MSDLAVSALGTSMGDHAGRCNGFLAESTQPDSLGYLFAFFSVFFFGTNFIPVKQYKTGDGMFFQFVMCTGIFVVGLIVNSVRNQPQFQPFAMLGGALWATGNVMCVPIIKTIGIGVGMLIWGATNMCIGWATGAFGLFGLPMDCTRCTTCAPGSQAATCSINHGRNYAGFAITLAALAVFVQIKSDGTRFRLCLFY